MNDLAEQFKELIPLQKKQCEIVEYIDSVCKEHNITYCLAYGSALGARRHKGPIPWDDDMDIYMTASDYERFKSVLNSKEADKRFYLQECKIDDICFGNLKVRMNGTTFIEESRKNMDMHQGIYVDIFLLDNCPPTFIDKKKAIIANMYLILKDLSNRNYNKRKAVVPLMWILRLFPKDFGVKTALHQLKKWNGSESDVFADWELYAGTPRWFIPKDVIFPVVRAEYAGHQFCVPHDIERYLEICYGDWKQIPKIDKIEWAQHAAQWSTTEDFRNYCPNIHDFSDEKL